MRKFTRQLIRNLQAWAATNQIRNKDLAGMIEVSPQGLSEIFGGRNNPTSEQTLRILELMKSPRNLSEASEMLDALEAENATLKAQAAAPPPPPPPPAKPVETRQVIIPIRRADVPKEISSMSLEELRCALNIARNPEMQQTLYAAIKAKQKAEKLPPYQR